MAAITHARYVQRLSEGYVAEPLSVPAARHAAESVKGVLGSHVCERVCLLVSELVTNAVVHRARGAGNAVRLRVWTSATTVKASVTGGGTGFRRPRLPTPGDAAAGGWGLFLVDRMADRWGVRSRSSEVWFEIDR